MNVRTSNQTATGGNFDEATIQAVWNRGRIIPNYDPNLWRWDTCGAVMSRREYGMISDCGWEIDHIKPVAHGGGDTLSNLQPLQWRNNRRKGDSLNWDCN